MAMEAGFAVGAAGPGISQAPRKIGLLQRVEGVRGGLDEIYGRLMVLGERVTGSSSASTPVPPSNPVGLPANVEHAEDRVRAILQLIGAFEQTL